MAQQHINIGTPNGKDGDTVRSAFSYSEDNFTELYNLQFLYNRIISASVAPISGLTFAVYVGSYIINKTVLPSSPINTTVTLSTADPGLPRKDVIAVDESENIIVIEGTPAADPSEPVLTDPNTQLKLTVVDIAAGATSPSNVSVENIYLENIGDPGEWDAAESTSGARINTGSTSDPDAGTIHLETTGIQSGDIITFSIGTPVSLVGINALRLRVKNKDLDATKFKLNFWLGDLKISQNDALIEDGSFAFDDTDNTDYQTILIPATYLTLLSNSCDKIEIECTDSLSGDIRIDNVVLHYGLIIEDNLIPPLQDVLNAGNTATQFDGVNNSDIQLRENGALFQFSNSGSGATAATTLSAGSLNFSTSYVAESSNFTIDTESITFSSSNGNVYPYTNSAFEVAGDNVLLSRNTATLESTPAFSQHIQLNGAQGIKLYHAYEASPLSDGVAINSSSFVLEGSDMYALNVEFRLRQPSTALDDDIYYIPLSINGNFADGDGDIDLTEEDVIGTATIDITMTGNESLDLKAFSSHRGILIGNVDLDLTGLPAEGETIVKTLDISSTAAETFVINTPAGYTKKVIDAYINDTTLNRVTLELVNYGVGEKYMKITYENFI